MPAIFIIVLILVTVAGFAFRHWRKSQARAHLLQTPLSDTQWATVIGQVPLVKRLPSELRSKFEGKVNVFLDQVEFVGCNGLDVTEEMELSIAAQACLLVVNSDTWYDHLTTVLIYPGAFKSMNTRHEGYVVKEVETVRTGESWSRGPVILSWADTVQNAMDDRDGHNVVLHEFAHQIDDLSGRTDGIPVLNNGQSFAVWERVFVDAFTRHTEAVHQGRNHLINAYGAEGYEEFFAVSVEVFFEKPSALKRDEPAIYDQLSKLFAVDPVSWK